MMSPEPVSRTEGDSKAAARPGRELGTQAKPAADCHSPFLQAPRRKAWNLRGERGLLDNEIPQMHPEQPGKLSRYCAVDIRRDHHRARFVGCNGTVHHDDDRYGNTTEHHGDQLPHPRAYNCSQSFSAVPATTPLPVPGRDLRRRPSPRNCLPRTSRDREPAPRRTEKLAIPASLICAAQ